MARVQPVQTVHLFPGLLQELLDVLGKLKPQEWDLPTPCPGWSVHDVVAHILGGELGQLSMGRDGYRSWLIDADSWDQLVEGLNDLNEKWAVAMRRLSPQLLMELMESAGGQVNEHFRSLDPNSSGPPVDWAGADPAPIWMHIAREYTERWHHQQQIRETVGKPVLTEPEWFAPVLATFAHGFPRSYLGVSAAVGTVVRVEISGASGGTWEVALAESGWVLRETELYSPTARVIIDEVDAWKLFTKSIERDEVKSKVVIEGDLQLGLKALETVSIIA